MFTSIPHCEPLLSMLVGGPKYLLLPLLCRALFVLVGTTCVFPDMDVHLPTAYMQECYAYEVRCSLHSRVPSR